MKIAIIAPVLRKISKSNNYGGIERIIASLAIGSANAGHKVTLYAPFGTDLKHKNIQIRFTTKSDLIGGPKATQQAETELFKILIKDQDQFDIIHSHLEPIIAKNNNGNYFDQINKPIVVTFHNQTYIKENIDYYKTHDELNRINYVFISKDQLKPLHFFTQKTVIYNGIDFNDLSFNASPNTDQLAFLGRITPEKGILQAISIAKLSHKRLVIGAAIDKSQQLFFDKKIKPQIDNKNIVFLGEVNSEQRNDLLRNSQALLFPIQWHEPFGLVIIEAMATGTPVIAAGIGSTKEIIEEGKNGYIENDINNPISYIKKIDLLCNINRRVCRQTVLKKFNEKTMVKNYLSFYKTII